MAITKWLLLNSIVIIVNLVQILANDCWTTRSQAETRDENQFVPECTRDGLFASVQCHKSSGYCWCVDVMSGRPRSQTTTRNKTPNCNNSGRRSTARDPNRRKEKRFCNSSQRVLFNTQLLSVFVSERSRRSGQHSNESSIWSAIEAKFGELDQNSDQRVTKQEAKNMVQMIKKLLPTFRVCAQQMFTFCDQNNDSFITRAEFNECLNFDFSFRAFLSLNSSSSSGQSSEGRPETHVPKRTGFQNPFELNARSDENATESRLDCPITRSNALESLRVNPSGELFIPECTKDGYYVRIQCHKSYCWCVSRVTGQPIKTLEHMSTNRLNSQLNCDSMRKGCDQRRRNKFHLRLRQSLEKDNTSCAIAFGRIDSNANQLIENQEWKSFRQVWRTGQTFNSRLRKCFRTEIQYCDQNFDRKLSRQEWLQCCRQDSQRIIESESDSSEEQVHHRGVRRHKKLGPNPLETILISE